MTAFATFSDVAAVWRALTTDEEGQVTRRLEQASRIIRQRIGDIDARVGDGSLDAALVRDVVVDMVLRYLKNPEGYRQEAIEDYSRTRDTALSEGKIYLTDDELELLSATANSTTFSVKPATEPSSYAIDERVAANRVLWS